jgi:chromate reductase, NAD(P)H dehydrogenase (quinone)
MNEKLNVLAFGASGSKKSINQQLAVYAANQMCDDANILDISNYQLPLYTVDFEEENGLPLAIEDIYSKIKASDVLIISLSEHNGTYTTFFKNIFDWLSRRELKFLTGKKIFLLATAPGPRGGQGVLDAAVTRFPIHGCEIVGTFILPKFYENFDQELGIKNTEIKNAFFKEIEQIKQKINQLNTIEN